MYSLGHFQPICTQSKMLHSSYNLYQLVSDIRNYLRDERCSKKLVLRSVKKFLTLRLHIQKFARRVQITLFRRTRSNQIGTRTPSEHHCPPAAAVAAASIAVGRPRSAKQVEPHSLAQRPWTPPLWFGGASPSSCATTFGL